MLDGSGLDKNKRCADVLDIDHKGLIEMGRELIQTKKLHVFSLWLASMPKADRAFNMRIRVQ